MKLIIRLITIISVVLFAMSCNSVKRVIKDPKKFESVGRAWEKVNPCNNDTTYISEKDTTILLDTLYNIYTDTVVINNEPTIVIKRVPQIITKTLTIRDTVKVFTVDNRRLNIALDSVNYYKGLTQQFKAKYEQQIAETKQQRARGNKWLIYFIGACIILLISHYLRSKL